MKKKENNLASYHLNVAKGEMDRAIAEFEKKGQTKEADQLFKLILKIEEWQVKHC